MNAMTLVCANCGSRLTVSAAAPRVGTCPRCLYRMVNPHAAHAEVPMGTPTSPPFGSDFGQLGRAEHQGRRPAPMRVLPLETQASADTGATNVVLVVMIVLLAA